MLKQNVNTMITFLSISVFELEFNSTNASYAKKTAKTPDRECIISS
ncbi:MAG: hypothetical protein ACRDDE_05560 [Paraclostridium sp.]